VLEGLIWFAVCDFFFGGGRCGKRRYGRMREGGEEELTERVRNGKMKIYYCVGSTIVIIIVEIGHLEVTATQLVIESIHEKTTVECERREGKELRSALHSYT
jgi:hypothetical protein